MFMEECLISFKMYGDGKKKKMFCGIWLGSKDLGFKCFRTSICNVGKP